MPTLESSMVTAFGPLMIPSVIHNLRNEAYHAGPGISVSQIKRLKRTPLHMHALTLPRAAPESAPSPQMFNGTLVHCALLERAEFDRRYMVGPEVNKLTKEWKAFKADCEVQHLTPIDQLQRDRAFAQADSLAALPECAELMADGVAETSAYWHDHSDPADPVLCRCRPDWVSFVGRGTSAILMDVKTAQDASPEGFSKAVAAFGYHQQADWYCKGYEAASGLQVHGMVFVVVESEYPFAAKAHMLSDKALATAAEENAAALALYRACRAAGDWPGYGAGISIVDLPPWYSRKAA